MPRREPGVRHFVVAFRFESDRVSMNRFVADTAQHAGYRRTVGSAAQEARRRRAFRFLRDGLPDDLREAFEPAAQIAAVAFDENRFPVADRLLARHGDLHRMSGLDPPDVGEYGLRRRDDVKIQIVVDRLGSSTPLDPGTSQAVSEKPSVPLLER